MNKIERFEDLKAWQKARELSNEFKQFIKYLGELK